MDSMQRVLEERYDDFARVLTHVGFTRPEAERFVVEAWPAVLRSYEWQERSLGLAWMARPGAAREILSTISGRRLASLVGLPEQKTWAGLRELVPAVLQASNGRGASQHAAPEHPSMRRGRSGRRPTSSEYSFGSRD
jgi:hypothetical protein